MAAHGRVTGRRIGTRLWRVTRSEGVNLVDKTELCKLANARVYIDGLMAEVAENSTAWEALNGCWCILNEALEKDED